MKKRKIIIIVGGALVLVVAIVAIVIGIINSNNQNTDEESWTNLTELSGEFMNNYFAEYAEMRENSDPNNILIVASRTRPADYGAERIVEAPNYTWFLQYATAEEKDAAYMALSQDDSIQVSTNDQIIELEQDEQAENIMAPVAVNRTHMSWGVSAMGLDTAISKVAELGKNTEEVKVAVIDTGIAQDIFEHYYPNRLAAAVCVSAGEETCKNFNGTLTDLNGHGSHVAGIVADGTPDNVHIVAILAYTMINNEQGKTGTFVPSDLITAINRAHEEGADVINMSLGWHDVSEDGSSKIPSLERAINAVVEDGTIVVASSGNNGGTEPHYPSGYDSVISVGALVALPQNCSLETRCSWSVANNHTYSDYEQNDYMLTHMVASSHNSTVEFAAPGSGIASLNYQSQDEVAYKSGTSMASPHVAAAVAIVKSFNPNIGISGVRQVLTALSIDLTEAGKVTTTVSDDNIITGETVEMITGLTGRDEYYGFGIIDFNQAEFCNTEQCDDYGVLTASSVPTSGNDNPSLDNPGGQTGDAGGNIGFDDGELANLSKQQYIRTCFSDVAPDGFYAGAVKWAYYDRYGDYGSEYPGYNGRITIGVNKCENGSGGEFGAKEQDIVLRRDALVMLWRLAGEPELTSKATLKDGKAYNSYADYSAQAIDYLCRIVDKDSDCTNTRNSKEAMTAIGWAANLMTVDENGKSEALLTGIEGRAIVDGEEKSVIYYDAEGELSRPQVMVFLYRFYNYFYDEDEGVWMLPTEPVTKWSS